MGIALTVLGLAVIGYGLFGVSQPPHNKPGIFRTPAGSFSVFAVGLGLLALAAL